MRCLVMGSIFSFVVMTCPGEILPAHAATIRVPDDAPTIQDGIDLASAGDTVLVACGLYQEHDILMKSGVCVRGETGHPGCVIVHAQDSGQVFRFENVDSSAAIEGLTITGGLASGVWPADCGGGVFCSDASPRITDCRFQWNEADNTGGALYCQGSSAPALTNVAFHENSAVLRGGALGLEGNSSPSLSQITFFRNSAGNRGGGIYTGSSSSVVLTGCTFFGNSAADGSGIASRENSSSSIDRTIIAFGQWGEAVYSSAGAVTTLSCSDLFGNAGGDWVGSIAGQYGINGNFSADPLFCDTLSADLQLYSASPCADAPGCGLVGSWAVGCQPWYVLPDSTGDAPTIAAAMDSASAGETILVAAGTYYEHDITMKNGVALIGESGSACTVIDAQQRGRVLDCCDVDDSTLIQGLTLTGGVALGADVMDGGGGVRCISATLRIVDCVLLGNSAEEYGGGMVCATGSSPTLIGCRFTENSSGFDGGAIYCKQHSSPIIVGGELTHNSAVRHGGGISCREYCSPDLTDCTFSSNSSGGQGGALYCYYYSNPLVVGCTFAENSAGDDGGALLFVTACSPHLTNCVFRSNSASDQGGVALCQGASIPVFDHCLLCDNSAGSYGGAMSLILNVTPVLENCTITANSAPNGSGFYLYRATPSLDRCILSFGLQGAAVLCGSEAAAVFTCTDVYGNDGGDWTDCIADQQETSGNLCEDPLFCDPENEDYRLRSCSQCLNSTVCDQIGAYGLGPCVRQWRILPDGSGDAPTIQAAVDSAGGCDTLLVAPGTYLENITLKHGMFLLSEGGASVTSIRSNGDADWVVACHEVGPPDVLRGFTIDGVAGEGETNEQRTGAYSCMRIEGGATPWLEDCVLRNALVNGIECRDNANPVIGGSLGSANRILTPVGVANFTSNTIDATYNWWGQEDHGCPENNYGSVQVVPLVDASLGNVIGDCYTLFVPEHFGSIQSAIDVAIEGDTVEVAAAGDVYEENVAVYRKDVTLRVGSGDGRPTIRSSVSPVVRLDRLSHASLLDGFVVDANSGETGVYVDSSSATVAHCRVLGATGSGLGGSGVILFDSDGSLLDNEIEQNDVGVLSLHSGTRLSGNRITGNQRGVVTSGAVLPVVGGSLEEANDIHDNAQWNLENQESDSLNAEYNFWGTVDYEEIAATITGPVRFCYWTDSTHTEVYSCGMTEVDGRDFVSVPEEFYLAQNAPNPFNPVTLIGFAVPAPGACVEIGIYNVEGRCVRDLMDTFLAPGNWSASWDGRDERGVGVSPGVYFCRMKAEGFTATRKMVLVE
jgi:predicted outer membrane repeat protein